MGFFLTRHDIFNKSAFEREKKKQIYKISVCSLFLSYLLLRYFDLIHLYISFLISLSIVHEYSIRKVSNCENGVTAHVIMLFFYKKCVMLYHVHVRYFIYKVIDTPSQLPVFPNLMKMSPKVHCNREQASR